MASVQGGMPSVVREVEVVNAVPLCSRPARATKLEALAHVAVESLQIIFGRTGPAEAITLASAKESDARPDCSVCTEISPRVFELQENYRFLMVVPRLLG